MNQRHMKDEEMYDDITGMELHERGGGMNYDGGQDTDWSEKYAKYRDRDGSGYEQKTITLELSSSEESFQGDYYDELISKNATMKMYQDRRAERYGAVHKYDKATGKLKLKKVEKKSKKYGRDRYG